MTFKELVIQIGYFVSVKIIFLVFDKRTFF